MFGASVSMRGSQVCGHQAGGAGSQVQAAMLTDVPPLQGKKSLAGMKVQAEANGDSDAEDPRASPEAEGTSQQGEEEGM